MIVLAFDTATADTALGLRLGSGEARTVHHRPDAGERPGHSTHLLALARGLLAEAGLGWADVDRIGVGTGPGTFTGLRIGVSTARALAQAGGRELVGISTLEALAIRAADYADTAEVPARTSVLACLDARRSELYVAARRAGDPRLDGPRALSPAALPALLGVTPGPWLAVGDGAVRYRAEIEAAGAEVAADADARHHVDGAALCALALLASPVGPDALEPEYVRDHDAVPTHLR